METGYIALSIAVPSIVTIALIFAMARSSVKTHSKYPWIVLLGCAIALFVAPRQFEKFDAVPSQHSFNSIAFTGTPAVVTNILLIVMWITAVVWSIVMLRRGSPPNDPEHSVW